MSDKPAPKKATSFRLSTEAMGLLAALSNHMGISQTSVIEVAIRDLARERGVAVMPGDGRPA